MARLASLSASLFCSRRTWEIENLGIKRDPAESGVIKKADIFVLDLVIAVDLLHDQLRVGEYMKFFTASERRRSERR